MKCEYSKEKVFYYSVGADGSFEYEVISSFDEYYEYFPDEGIIFYKRPEVSYCALSKYFLNLCMNTNTNSQNICIC